MARRTGPLRFAVGAASPAGRHALVREVGLNALDFRRSPATTIPAGREDLNSRPFWMRISWQTRQRNSSRG